MDILGEVAEEATEEAMADMINQPLEAMEELDQAAPAADGEVLPRLQLPTLDMEPGVIKHQVPVVMAVSLLEGHHPLPIPQVGNKVITSYQFLSALDW